MLPFTVHTETNSWKQVSILRIVGLRPGWPWGRRDSGRWPNWLQPEQWLWMFSFSNPAVEAMGELAYWPLLCYGVNGSANWISVPRLNWAELIRADQNWSEVIRTQKHELCLWCFWILHWYQFPCKAKMRSVIVAQHSWRLQEPKKLNGYDAVVWKTGGRVVERLRSMCTL